jgi:hypothetical protein
MTGMPNCKRRMRKQLTSPKLKEACKIQTRKEAPTRNPTNISSCKPKFHALRQRAAFRTHLVSGGLRLNEHVRNEHPRGRCSAPIAHPPAERRTPALLQRYCRFLPQCVGRLTCAPVARPPAVPGSVRFQAPWARAEFRDRAAVREAPALAFVTVRFRAADLELPVFLGAIGPD